MSSEQLAHERDTVKAQWRHAIDTAGEALLRHAIIEVPANSAGWLDSGIDVVVGASISLLSVGKVQLSAEPEISFGANLFLWYRIGETGTIARLAAATATFTATQAGRLMLVGHYPAAWLDQAGNFDPSWPRSVPSGSLSVAILVWKDGADDGLALFAAHDNSRLALAEHARVRDPHRQPRGWQPIWRLGETEIYRDSPPDSGAPRIDCRCCGNAGIVKYPVDLALDASTRLQWRWRVLELPSLVGENSVPTHDYLSIAVEFDNGLDLTYMWSAALPPGTVFRCPLPWWDQRETHQVVRSGAEELGRWLDQDQGVLADYARAIGGPPPARIVGVWLIAVAAFQRRSGACEYQAIRLGGSGGRVVIGP
jgi:hypothetical protein